VIGDLIRHQIAIVHIHWLQALFFIYEGMVAAGLKEEAGSRRRFAVATPRNHAR